MVAKKSEKAEVVALAEKTGAVAVSEKNRGLAAKYEDGPDDLGQDDLLISRILLAQAQSKYVAAEKASAGQLVGSLEHDLLADKKQTLEIIPFHRTKTFRLFKPVPGGGIPKFITEVPYNAETIEWEKKRLREVLWTYTNGDKKEVKENLSCFISWNYYCLLASQVESLPRVISFSSTSYVVGKKLGTLTLEAKKQGFPLPFKTYKVGTEHVTNDKGSFYKLTVDKGRSTTDAELSNVGYWADLAMKGAIAVDADVDEGGGGGDSFTAQDVEAGRMDADAEY